MPADGGDGDEDTDPLAKLKAGHNGGAGQSNLGGKHQRRLGAGAGGSAAQGLESRTLGPAPPAGLVEARRDAYLAILAACGSTPGDLSADGTAQREVLRRWHMGTVLPLARILEWELSNKLGETVTLAFDKYPQDLAGRAQAFQKMVAGGMGMTEAAAASGIMVAADDA